MTDEANRRGVGAVAEAMEGRTPERVAYAWPDLPGMMTIPFFPEPWSDAWWGLKVMAGAGLDRDEFNIGWFDNPQNTGWQRGPDMRAIRNAGRQPLQLWSSASDHGSAAREDD
jgi:hypothetical protein